MDTFLIILYQNKFPEILNLTEKVQEGSTEVINRTEFAEILKAEDQVANSLLQVGDRADFSIPNKSMRKSIMTRNDNFKV